MKSVFKLIPFIFLTLNVVPRVNSQNCSQQYIVVSGDTCNGIGAEFNVTGSSIISANPSINSGCTNLQGGQILCIPGGSCPLEYTVEKNDTCNRIGAKFNVTGSGIISANPIISYGCNNLTVGKTLCIPNLSCVKKYTIGSGDTCNGIGSGFNITGSAIISANPTINSGCTNLQVGQVLCIPDQSCSQEYTVESDDTCDGIGDKFNVTGSAIIAANPTVSYGCDDLPVGQTLCIRNETCMQRYIVVSGDTCNGIGAEFSVTGSDIISANPAINSACTNLQVGQNLCIPDRSCIQKYKVVSGDVCYGIGSQFGVTAAAIMSANPTIDSMCYFLQIGQIICIPDRSCMQKYNVLSGDTCSSIGTEFGVTGTAINSANPTINSGCTNLQVDQILCIPDKSCMLKYIVVSSNETCYDIGAEFNVTGSDIISANPIIDSGCTNLQVGQILCIPDGSCAHKYAVVSGDTCNLIGAMFGVTGSAIMTANPTINSECTNLQVGQILCIPGSGRGTIDNWESCTTSSTCADNWLCCVGPADCATQKTTCRPGGTECSSCDGGTSNPLIPLITTSPTSSPVPPTHSPHLKVLFVTIFTLLGGIIVAIIVVLFFSLSRSRGQSGVQKTHGEGSTTQEEQTSTNPDVPSTVHIHNSDDVSSIGNVTRKTAILNNW